jgi:hypothetical protein
MGVPPSDIIGVPVSDIMGVPHSDIIGVPVSDIVGVPLFEPNSVEIDIVGAPGPGLLSGEGDRLSGSPGT